MHYRAGRRRPFFLLWLSLAVVAALARPAGAEDKLDLRLKLKKGSVYRLKLTLDQQIVVTPATAANGEQSRPRRRQPPAAQPPRNIEQVLSVNYTMTVENVDAEGAMTIQTRYDAVLFRRKGATGAVEYDSAKPPKQPPAAAQAFAVLPGLGFTMTLTADGTVKSVQGIDALIAEVIRRLELPQGPAKASTRTLLAEHFGEAAMKQNMQNLFALYPPRPVAAGESWTRKIVVSKGFPLVIDGTYRLKSRDGGVAEIEINAKLAPNADAAPVEVGTGKMTYDLSGSQRGSARVDEATGWTVSLKTEQDVSGAIGFDTPGEQATSIPITMKSKVVLEPLEGAAAAVASPAVR